ncbi:FAD-dependent oxidoreductase [Ventosimonas gracilis]|uniref:FAD-dependent oxidoreductase n=1 Tax=Ventosimonas gracilis TaxID=1680762 RepID=A0A139SWP4_9GAMM|nr:NAD(P)-binding protein [Ventosimonas gracilis]KXU39056.1 FAD-dependent oxidoreductase [Ventosimonas gracilis]
MNWNKQDKQLGMDKPITRRDFLDGVAITASSLAAAKLLMPLNALAEESSIYPPLKNGLTGQTNASFNIMHAIRDGSFWNNAPQPINSGEHYDLVVVGAGLSGLAAAFIYRQQAGADKSVLLIDPLDDFGGHAKRNEYISKSGKALIGYGGSQSLDTPGFFSPAVHQLLRDLGINLERFETWFEQNWQKEHGLAENALFFCKEQWGQDKLVIRTDNTAEWVSQTPLNSKAKADLISLIDAPKDFLAELSREDKLQKLSDITYQEFLLNYAKVDAELALLYQSSTMAYFGAGIDAVSALDAWTNGSPGFDGMDLGDAVHKNMAPSGRVNFAGADPYIHHFPEGNAGVARALVRQLIPQALPGHTMEDISLARLNYGQLDNPHNKVRIRLHSSAVKVAHQGSPENADKVTVSYADEQGKLFSVNASHVILACWNRVIPYLTDELPRPQIDALNDQQKVPLIYGNVLIRNWKAFDKLKIDSFSARGHFWRSVGIDFPVSVGNYRFAQSPNDPVLLHLSKVFAQSGAGNAREQFRLARWQLFNLSFSEMERSIRDLLNRALGAGGFNAARDIEAITFNRWAHGYAYEYMRPWDNYWPDGELPIFRARKPWGRIAIANADSGAYAYAHSALDQGIRAVRDLLGTPAGAPDYSHFPGPPLDKLGLA